jgi:probable phosphomutase (TIGR03848 family)
MTTLLLIRHGQNDMVADRLAGRMPGVHLNDHGRQQAQQIINMLEGIPVRAVYSSPLERALETAKPLAEVRGLPVSISQDLIELDYGDWQGRTYKSLKRLPLWTKVLNEPEISGFPNGETFVAVQQRACNELKRIASSHRKKDVVACFTHGDIIRLALAHFLSMPLIGFHRFVINTGSITVLFFDKENCPFLVHTNISEGVALKPLV